ncbi:MAG: hypothetical protein SGPRY_010765 [Prymnesium sp.]
MMTDQDIVIHHRVEELSDVDGPLRRAWRPGHVPSQSAVSALSPADYLALATPGSAAALQIPFRPCAWRCIESPVDTVGACGAARAADGSLLLASG